MNNFQVTSKLGDYQQLLETVTAQVDAQLERIKSSTQKFIRRVVAQNQSPLRSYGSANLARLPRGTRFSGY